MSEVRRVLLANGQYIEIVQETGTSTGAVMSQSAVTAALSGKANTSHNHVAGNITGGTFGTAMIADGAITTAKLADGKVTSGKLANSAVTTAKILDKAVTKAKLADDVINSLPSSSYETVIVTATVSDNYPTNGLLVSINGVQYTFNSTGKVYAMVPYNQVYSVTPVSSNTVHAAGGGTYTASTGNRSVSVVYFIDSGVFIEDKQGMLYTTADWSSGNNANANSVVVMTDAHSFRIALQGAPSKMQMNSNYTDPWYGFLDGTINSGTHDDETAAKADYSGAVNTQLIVAKCQPSTTYAAGWSNAYTFPNGVTKGYLPALGELYLAYQNKAAIDAALAKCGGTALSSSYHLSSTYWGMQEMFDETGQKIRWNYSWYISWRSGSCGYSELTDAEYVRAFGAY